MTRAPARRPHPDPPPEGEGNLGPDPPPKGEGNLGPDPPPKGEGNLGPDPPPKDEGNLGPDPEQAQGNRGPCPASPPRRRETRRRARPTPARTAAGSTDRPAALSAS